MKRIHVRILPSNIPRAVSRIRRAELARASVSLLWQVAWDWHDSNHASMPAVDPEGLNCVNPAAP
jgi:hypothetical protein